MPKVGIVMGSDSDMKVISKAADMLEKFGVEYEMTIISAHREPDVFYDYAKSAEEKDFKVIIARPGMAAHLPGMCAAIFPMPVTSSAPRAICKAPIPKEAQVPKRVVVIANMSIIFPIPP